MRMIDADELKNQIRHMPRTINPDLVQYSLVKAIIENMPTLTPPNEPLTYEQLREMDGEPVWIEDVKHWALIDIEKGGQWDGAPFVVWAENGVKFTYNVKSRDLHCYLRPPEGEEEKNV